MFIQFHVICIFMFLMKHQDLHNDWFMWTKVSYVWINLGYCRNICLRISRAVAVKKFCPKLWNARTSNEVQRVENWQIFFNNLSTFKIDLRKLWNQRPVRSFRRAHRRRKMRACMMLESTETIAIEDAFPSRAALLLRRSFHNIRYNLCVWRRSWRWVRRCPAAPSTMVHPCRQLDLFLESSSTWLI